MKGNDAGAKANDTGVKASAESVKEGEKPTATQPRQQRTSLLAGALSIGSVKPVQVVVPRLQAEVKELTQEDLARYWQEAAAELGLEELMAQAEVKLGEHPGRIEIDAQTVGFNDDFKPHRINVMEALRRRTGMPMLDCKVNPLFIAKDEVIYSPNDKYNAMLSRNPKLLELRKLFPQIDY